MSGYNVVGIMSGTSLDGMDLAFCTLRKENGKWQYELPEAETIPYPEEMKEMLSACQYGSASTLVEAHNEFGIYTAKAVNGFLDKYDLVPDLISSHGHTVFHQPEKGITFQLGNGAVIAAQTGITTIADFRTMDVANGGQGAPLVPIGDELLFGDYAACLNLGGFSNISYKINNKRIAFDICPVNTVLNYLAGKMGKEMDEEGKVAAEGKMIDELFEKLENMEYYKKPYPKSLGKEWVEENIFPLFEYKNYNVQDLLRTYTEHAAERIVAEFSFLSGKALITGGGALNTFLTQRIKEKTHLEIVLPDLKIINYKEALIFALLGVLRFRNEVNCLSSVTGARSNISSGVIYSY